MARRRSRTSSTFSTASTADAGAAAAGATAGRSDHESGAPQAPAATGGPTLLRADLVLLLAIALLARLLYLLAVRDELLFQVVVGDSEIYLSRAHAFLEGVRAEQHAFTPPLYPLYLASILMLAGENLELVRWLQAGGGAIAALAVAVTAGYWSGRLAGWVAGLIMALSPVVLFFEGELLSAAPVLLLVSTAMLAATRAHHTHRLGWCALSGALLGGAALGQPNVVLLLGGIGLWVLGRAGARAHRAAALRRLAVVVAALAVVILAGIGVQRASSGYWVPISANGGVNLYIGNHDGAEGGFDLPPDSGLANDADGLYPSARRVAAAALGESDARPIGPRDVSAYWAGRAGTFLRADPRRSAALLLRKLLVAFNRYEIPNHYAPAFFGRYTPLVGWNPIRFWWVAPLGVLGFAFAGRIRHPAAHGMLVAVTAYALGLALFFITSRYRLPLWPWLALGGGMSVAAFWPVRRRWRLWLPAAVTLLVLVGLSVLPAPVPFSRGHTTAILARQLSLRGDAGAARQALEEAASHGDLPEVAHNLANAYYREGRLPEAAVQYGRALELRPGDASATYGLGMCALEQGAVGRAVEFLAASMALDPTSRKTRRNLGRALLRSGRPEEAVAVLGALLDDQASVAEFFEFGLGAVHLGRLDSARTAFEAALQLDPASTGVRINLALVLEDQGELAAARRQLEAIGDSGPHQLERLLGLGRIARRQGRVGDARGHFERARALAPDDARVRHALESLRGVGP